MKKISVTTETVQKPVEVVKGIVVELTVAEAQYIANRLNCSSFKTFRDYQEENGLKHIARAPIAAKFNEVISGL
jgi:hypothetical protein